MPTGTVSLRARVYDNGRAVTPGQPDLTHLNNFLHMTGGHEVTADATNETVPLGTEGTNTTTFIWDDSGDSADDLTIRINGSTQDLPLQPWTWFTGNITAVTATNSDADNEKRINWVTVNT